MYFLDLFLATSLLQVSLTAVLPREVEADDDFDAAEAINETLGFAEDVRIECATGVQMIVARGTNQKAVEGSMTNLANEIMDQIPGSQAVGLQYPASKNPTYEKSEGKGSNHMTQYIEYFSTKCPDTKLVLLGYSQGGQLTMDALCGTSSGGGFADTSPLPPRFRDNIHAVVVWGDPSHVANQTYDRGTSTHDGIFTREASSCDPFVSKLCSYCDAGDPYCDEGNDLGVHKSYSRRYTDASARFVVNKVT